MIYYSVVSSIDIFLSVQFPWIMSCWRSNAKCGDQYCVLTCVEMSDAILWLGSSKSETILAGFLIASYPGEQPGYEARFLTDFTHQQLCDIPDPQYEKYYHRNSMLTKGVYTWSIQHKNYRAKMK